MSWDPAQYLRYGGERLRPALDLLTTVVAESPLVVVDLGCGAGNVTGLLRRRWPDAVSCWPTSPAGNRTGRRT
jgi:trans-aconitate 2-methyltransferase